MHLPGFVREHGEAARCLAWLQARCSSRASKCRDKGRMWGGEGALCLSWSGSTSPGGFCSEPTRIVVRPGQAQGPRIHPTPPLVPTGRGRTSFPVLIVKLHHRALVGIRSTASGKSGILCSVTSVTSSSCSHPSPVKRLSSPSKMSMSDVSPACASSNFCRRGNPNISRPGLWASTRPSL